MALSQNGERGGVLGLALCLQWAELNGYFPEGEQCRKCKACPAGCAHRELVRVFLGADENAVFDDICCFASETHVFAAAYREITHCRPRHESRCWLRGVAENMRGFDRSYDDAVLRMESDIFITGTSSLFFSLRTARPRRSLDAERALLRPHDGGLERPVRRGDRRPPGLPTNPAHRGPHRPRALAVLRRVGETSDVFELPGSTFSSELRAPRAPAFSIERAPSSELRESRESSTRAQRAPR